MFYTIAGIDVHKKILVVVVAEVTEEGEWSYERGTFGTTAPELQRLAEWFQQRGVPEVVMESTAQYWRPVWGRTGAVLDAGDAATGRRRAHGREAPFGPGPVQSRTPGPEERLSGCGTVGASTGSEGTGAELCSRPGTTAVAHAHAPQAAVSRGPDAVSQPAGGASGTDAHQVVVLRFGSVGRERAAHARSLGRRRHGPPRRGGARRCEPARHPGTATRRLSSLDGKPRIDHFCLGVENFEAKAALAAAQAQGGTGRIRDGDGVPELYLQDPDGITVQVQGKDYRG
jgi:hypothetical protein